MDSQGKRRRKAADSSLTRTFPSTGGPAYDEALLTLLHGHGARFVLVADRETKRPVKGCNWLHGKPISLAQVLFHARRGGLLGLVPASLGYSVLDVDHGNPEALAQREPPSFTVPSRRSGRAHLYYRDDRARPNQRWQTHGASGEVRSGSGYVVLWAGAVDLLAVNLGHKPDGPGSHWPTVAYLPENPPTPRRAKGCSKELLSPPISPRRGEGIGEKARFSPLLGWLETVHEGHRNNALHVAVRKWAYQQERRGSDETLDEWRDRVDAFARVANNRFPVPLDVREVSSLAGKVAAFTWERPDFGRPKLGSTDSEAQRYAQHCQVLARRETNQGRDKEIVALHRVGKSAWAIARERPDLGSRGRIENVIRRDGRYGSR